MPEITSTVATASEFAPFGILLHDVADSARVWGDRPDAVGHIEMIRASSMAGDGVHGVGLMERHPHSTQAFLPVNVGAYLVVVAPDAADGMPDLSAIRAFVFPGDVAVQYRAGLWHAPMTVVRGYGLFAVHIHKDGTERDCDFVDIPFISVRVEEAIVPVASACPGASPDSPHPL